MKPSTWLVIVVGIVLAVGVGLFILNQPIKSKTTGGDCGTALHQKDLFHVEIRNGVHVPVGGDLCDGAGDSERTQAKIAIVMLLVLTVAVAVFDHKRGDGALTAKRDDDLLDRVTRGDG